MNSQDFPWITPLLAKYRELLRLRLGDRDGTIPDPRLAMAALAHRFPGALREIDRCPLPELERRLAHLEALGSTPGLTPEVWAPLGMRYHELLRGALAVRRWLAGQDPSPDLEARFAQDVDGLPFPEDARAWTGLLQPLATPPGGRITRLVLERLSRESGTPEAQVRQALFQFGPGTPS